MMDTGTQSDDFDMTQFHQMFFEEAEELLDAMETLLLNIDLEQLDDETMNAIFRTAHSIKGSSATFGFVEVAEVTHVAENLLDQVRNHTLRMTREMVDVLLKTGDVVRQQLHCHRTGDLRAMPEVEGLKQALHQLGASNHPLPVVQHPEVSLPVAPAVANLQNFSTAAPLFEKPIVLYRVTLPLPPGGVPQVVRDNLFGDLLMLGMLDEDPEGEPVGTMRFLFNTASDATELRTLLDFMLSTSGTRVEPYQHASSTTMPNNGAAYGLFDNSAGMPRPPAFGLFNEEDALAQAVLAETGYGFFTPRDPAGDVIKANTPGGDASDVSYGFFGALPPVSPAANSSAVAPVTTPLTFATEKITGTETKAATRKVEETSIRVSIEKVDQLINLVGELVITQAVLLQNSGQLDAAQHQQLFAGFADLERHTRDLQESVMSIRMLPISNVFSRFPRMLRDLAAKLGKKIELKTVGEGTDLDKGLIERITDPMTHLVRNALDHGIEMPDMRLAAGKPEHGTITLRAAQRGGNIVIEVSDDGGGLRREKIIAKAREKGLMIADTASDSEVWNLIFAPGFSTAEQVTDVSGRGVGMDVVKRNIIDMGGSVEITSVAGQGTTILIKLPLTLAIMDGMSVAIGGEVYVLPLASVIESIPLQSADLRSISGHGQVIEVREEYLPVLDLRDVFQVPRAEHSMDIRVVVEADGMKAALLVDDLVGQQQVVVKNLESNYRKVPGVAGATIMGDGSVALILDVAALVKRSRH